MNNRAAASTSYSNMVANFSKEKWTIYSIIKHTRNHGSHVHCMPQSTIVSSLWKHANHIYWRITQSLSVVIYISKYDQIIEYWPWMFWYSPCSSSYFNLYSFISLNITSIFEMFLIKSSLFFHKIMLWRCFLLSSLQSSQSVYVKNGHVIWTWR